MKELTQKNVEDIINWYYDTGVGNWGTWKDYPTLPVAATYHSFDTCHFRAVLSEKVSFDGSTFNCITDSRKVPGEGLTPISIHALKRALIEKGVAFHGEFTKGFAHQQRIGQLKELKERVDRFAEIYTYDYHYNRSYSLIKTRLEFLKLDKPMQEKLLSYRIVIKNGPHPKEIAIYANYDFVGANPEGTEFHYKLDPEWLDNNKKVIRDFAEVFANERNEGTQRIYKCQLKVMENYKRLIKESS